MSRLFDGSDDEMVYPVTGPTGAFSIMMVVRVITAADNTWHSWMEIEQAGTNRIVFGREQGGGAKASITVNTNQVGATGLTYTDSDNWMVAGVTKTAGTTTAKGHKCLIASVSNTHTNMDTTNVNPTTGATLRLGGNDDFANIRLAAAALWTGTALADSAYDGVASAKTTASIAALSPTWLVDDNDAFANDLIGSNHRSSIVGTADDADDPSGWVYGLGGAAATSLLWNPARYALTKR